ncbi:uncharacterized protein F5147DRAFT_763562 [Suillus discolor]|uniref:Uncharacterized protein n=1 Tax=Suillus discolor TaxID=1912936 RepID=A0A9P7JPB8_9AGAM|nr:uncharacterized protein F5147DRAFT_763562 [Suillus discolor]KAG2096345.1 hypothetical protein F5147DRAFT_763562 [Suillus discolor]
MKPGAASKQKNEGGMFLCFSTSTKNPGTGGMFKSSLLFTSARVIGADEGGDTCSCFTIPGGNNADTIRAAQSSIPGGDTVEARNIDAESLGDSVSGIVGAKSAPSVAEGKKSDGQVEFGSCPVRGQEVFAVAVPTTRYSLVPQVQELYTVMAHQFHLYDPPVACRAAADAEREIQRFLMLRLNAQLISNAINSDELIAAEKFGVDELA